LLNYSVKKENEYLKTRGAVSKGEHYLFHSS